MSDQGGKVGMKVVIGVALISLLVGLGVGENLERFAGTSPMGLLGEAGSSEVAPATTSQGLPDFVTLAKKFRPVVVNISTTQVSEGSQRP